MKVISVWLDWEQQRKTKMRHVSSDQVLANETMKSAKLKQHLITKHLEFKGHFFQRMGEENVLENTNGEAGHNLRKSTKRFLFSGSTDRKHYT